jgi:hypothetical protein
MRKRTPVAFPVSGMIESRCAGRCKRLFTELPGASPIRW